MTVNNVVVLWLVEAELRTVVAAIAGGSWGISGVLAVVGVLGQKKIGVGYNRKSP